ncbi:MBOAT family O-acyltransferase [Flavobacterium silvaticum]|uniref:MBOAT family protein n=1 Tax=Flavobacterium silvaticum TaxID=1852020 RepID=A0A972FWZ0_9FLAO|nr:MBOAT family protein [Flavobacterium silvaticum]NMH29557.1 MBOAT family protein [Flavobacterium silvaticum]
MLFNSLSYAVFLPLVFAIYWSISKKGIKLQNAMLLLCSYFFYACWDWRFLFLLLFSTGLDYYTGWKMSGASEKNRKFWFWLSISINLGFLGVFKYYNFFASSFADLILGFGLRPNLPLLNVILPVGISFYTFHGLSYVIDIYKKRIEPEKDIIDYSLFVSYFPLLVAGPIERATHLLPQLKKKREFSFETAKDGLYQIFWGLFKKVVIADSCARYANEIFDHQDQYNSLTLVLGVVYFAFQIYGDFSGYSDIAIGTSKLFGIQLLRNFNYPYFSRDIAEFWRRWHISLSSWFRDYLYIPLGGSKVNEAKRIRNTFIIFLVSGFWHGANWTFILWGFIHALFFLPLLLTGSNRNNIEIAASGKKVPSPKEFLQMLVTFSLVVFAWIFFRAHNVSQALAYIDGIIRLKDFSIQYLGVDRYSYELMSLLLLFVAVEWFSREREHPVCGRFEYAKAILLLFLILVLGAYSNPSDFIYFQF